MSKFSALKLSLIFALASTLMSCKPKQADTNTEAAAPKPAPAVTGQPFLSWLTLNNKESRSWAATHMERQLAPLLKSTNPKEIALREMVYQTIRALKEGGDKICADSAKITVYRGHGFGLMPTTKDGKKLIPANYLTMDLGRFSGTDWEAKAAAKYPAQAINFDTGLTRYAGATGLNCANGSISGTVGKYDYSALAMRHSLWCDNSLFISTTLDPEVTRTFKLPTIEARMCPGRLFPTSSQPFGNELEFLAFGFILPEEVVKIHNPEVALLYREGLTDPAKKAKAEDLSFSAWLPKPVESKLIECSGGAIAMQNVPEVGKWVEKMYNSLTPDLAKMLEQGRKGTATKIATWKADFSTKCNCKAYKKIFGDPRGELNCE